MLTNGVMPMPPARRTAGAGSPGSSENVHARAGRHRLQHTLERRVAHSRRDHELVLLGRAHDRERAPVAFRVGLRRVDEPEVQRLAGGEREAGGPGEAKRHRAFGDLLAVQELRFECGHSRVLRSSPD
jgi:hypothetical protein